MAAITHKGNPIQTIGSLPAVGTIAPDFRLTRTDLRDVSLADFRGKRLILNIFVSLDTSLCALAMQRFNEEATRLQNTLVLGISADLPFAHKRFCEAHHIENVITLSDMRGKAFGDDYGVRITTGVMAGLLSRAVVVIDADGKIIYTEQVPEIGQEPNYAAALAALQ